MKFTHQDYIYGVIGIAVFIMIATLAILIIKKFRNKLSMEIRWKELQKLLSQKSKWKEVIIQADQLLDETLRNNHFKGKTTGERLVAAQHRLSANDKIWYSHKLRNKIIYEEDISITKADVKKCLLGYWQALKDLGAFTKHEQ